VLHLCFSVVSEWTHKIFSEIQGKQINTADNEKV
jgi:hypothetical protein